MILKGQCRSWNNVHEHESTYYVNEYVCMMNVKC